ncbi:MAG TPA: thiamine-phosphate kinase [Actinospica sp.]|nr:thiamine-phosphate kinase [Actinospica sp.]
MTERSPGSSGDYTLGQIGEFGLINRVARTVPQGRAVLIGPGDDAALVRAADGRVVASTDLLVEGRHFRRDWSTGYQVGRKAAAQNLADIAAMGGVGTALLVGFAAPADLPLSWAAELSAGLADECALVGASVAGGDTVSSDRLLIAVTALGDLGGRPPVTRAGARSGDIVAYAGELGWSACGLDLLLNDADGPKLAFARHRSPEPPYEQGPAAARVGATAMLDISDGLLADLGHIAEESRVLIDLDAAGFPIDDQLRETARKRGVDVLDWILTGGEDHALAACFPPDAQLPPGWHVVGRVLEAEAEHSRGQEPPETSRTAPSASAAPSAPLVTVNGAPWATSAPGWDHFG